MSESSIVLCRHATTSANAEGRFLSRTDLPLDETGRSQCTGLRELFHSLPIETCFVSPAVRCLETHALALPAHPAIVRTELREIDFGAWEMMTPEDVRNRWPAEFARRREAPVDFRPPDGESFADVAMRLAPLLNDLQRGNVVVISHRGTLGVLERLLRGLPIDYRDIAPIEPAGVRFVSSIDVPRHAAPSGASKTSLQ